MIFFVVTEVSKKIFLRHLKSKQAYPRHNHKPAKGSFINYVTAIGEWYEIFYDDSE